MKSRTCRRWIWWLLPLLVARAFVPAGFMVASGEQGFELVVCSGFGPMQSSRAGHEAHHAGHGGHHGAAAEHSGSDQSSDKSPCPYALAGSPCAPVSALAIVAPVSKPLTIRGPTETVRGKEPRSLHRIRGPPLA